MKILMVSIFAPHFFNWAEQLRDSCHEVYWLDVLDSNTKVERIDFANQIVGWRYKCKYPGRYYLKKEIPFLNRLVNIFNERDFQTFFDKQLREINPDVVHSFVMYLTSAPIREVMKRHDNIKWVYSSWGSDLFFYRNRKRELEEIEKTLPHVNYMFADCLRDYRIAVENGFSGNFLGVFPGGGGYDLAVTDSLMVPKNKRKRILVKGYQGLHGRSVQVLQALWKIKEKIEERDQQIVVFGADEEVRTYVANSPLRSWKALRIIGQVPHSSVMQLMGGAFLYVGNSLSDGIPNTLLEAIIMGAFPVQSNPGGATAEVVTHRKNGMLIKDPENTEALAELLEESITDSALRSKAINWNLDNIKPRLERGRVREEVLKAYQLVANDL